MRRMRCVVCDVLFSIFHTLQRLVFKPDECQWLMSSLVIASRWFAIWAKTIICPGPRLSQAPNDAQTHRSSEVPIVISAHLSSLCGRTPALRRILPSRAWMQQCASMELPDTSFDLLRPSAATATDATSPPHYRRSNEFRPRHT